MSFRKLNDAEIVRQGSIRQLVINYLAQYPDVDLLYAESMFKDECKSSIFKIVTQMVSDKNVPLRQVQEAFDFYDWLPTYEPTPDDDATKKTLLHYACQHGRHDILALLLGGTYKPRITAQDEKGYIPLHVAAQSGNLKCLELVHESATEYLELCDFEGRTTLMIAAFFNQKDVVRQLLEWGANQVARDSKKETAMDIAKRLGHEDVAKIMKAHQNAKSLQHSIVAAFQRWLADPMHRRLYNAWQAIPVPHTNAPIHNFLFDVTAPHSIEADNIELVRSNRYRLSFIAKKQRIYLYFVII